ncbi:RNA-binding protein 20 isoform X1 [Ctenopharyngodon idella]|uniref:RNA-binding protein 20 isoform X1 n=3 Tax=Ctenopharyngodon idella TaxID=7959 RepID=UPI00222FBBAB|nr:RNA-binding protein 20 isoform X1 [Ctenopharyngodon idella]
MKQTWDKGVFENGQLKDPGNVGKASVEHLQSTSGEKLDNKSAPLGGAHGGVGQNLLLSPASLQLAQLQAQLTLHRLKLAQTTNTAAAATVLNQVLSNVAMSQPLFNHLRGSSMAQTHSGAFPPPPIAFPPPNTALGQLVGGGFTPNPTGIRPTAYSGVSNQKASQHNDFGKKAGTYSTDTDRRLQFGYLGGTSVVTSKPCDGGQYGGVTTQPRNNVHSNFQRDFYSSETPVQQTGFMGGSNDQNLGSVSSSANKEQWKGPINLGKMDMGTGTGSGGWVPPGPGFVGQRAELYNPEEPTADPKFNSTCGPGTGPPIGQQGGFQQQPQVSQGEEGVTLSLQPHQFNDYHGTTPSHLPHQCTICEKKVYNLKDWDQHVKGKLHLQNCSLYTESPTLGAVHFPVSSEGCLNMALSNTMAYTSAASQDVSTGSASYLPATAMKSFPLSGPGFTSGAKFLQRKACPGRVVHICNLPEGSCTENDVINLGLPFGKVTNYILMRSTHQAFLEMAYVEAAQAMVQYYQLQPATINGQKLLIRMSKRYKELQLKKPGKDVDSIIQDINSQRERDEMQETDRYLPERARSRSPVSRSLSPRSHSPSFTSCSSAHSPLGPSCRPDWSNGMGPRRASWDWTSHSRGDEDPSERDDWRNDEEERANGWLSERRKLYFKTGDRISPRMGPGDERGRDWYPRGSPQGSSFSSYHSIDDFYKKDSLYKTDKLSRPQHPRHEGKTKRREGGDYHRPRHSESDVMDDTSSNRIAEDRGRSKRSSRKQDKEEKESENQKEEYRAKERSASPHNSKPVESSKCDRDGDSEGLGSGDDGEEESWYPKCMEELVTVDEVGGEDDSIIEPDLPDLQEEDRRVEPSQSTTESPKPNAKTTTEGEDTVVDPPILEPLDLVPEESSGGAQSCPGETPLKSSAPEQPVSQLNQFPSQEFKSALEESCTATDMDTQTNTATPAGPPNHSSTCESGKVTDSSNDERKAAEMDNKEPCLKQDSQKKDIPDSLPAPSPQTTDISAVSPSQDQEKAISEHSIPLGVEFIVPRTGFYCNLCGLFYTSEQTAKTSHCRSTIHYRNLQKYLSQLAEESLLNFHTESPNTD